MSKNVRLALAQINATVGDLEGNRDKVLEYLAKAQKLCCDLVAFPELTITGYPPEDLILRQRFVQDQLRILEDIAGEVKETACVLGFVDIEDSRLYNATAIIHNGKIRAVYRKIHLPNYSVFDEERYFESGDYPLVISLNNINIGISICEDVWIPDSVIETQAFCANAEIMLNVSASPYYSGKRNDRKNLLKTHARRSHAVLAYVNLVGGQDELVFDGQSLIIDENGDILLYGKPFDEDLLVCDLDVSDILARRLCSPHYQLERAKFIRIFKNIQTASIESSICAKKPPLPPRHRPTPPSTEAEIYSAIVLGLKDYVQKNGFSRVTFGLSGGIDSALVAVLAVDALGSTNVFAVSMPSQYSSTGSITDAEKLAANLGIELLSFPITEVFTSYTDLLSATFAGLPSDITEENIQARIRANLLMALSNKFNWLVLTTGNKSEVSVGYSTIYGDAAGGFAPLKDVAKTMVYKLTEYRNGMAGYDLIPKSILEKAPSAELRPDQKDQDSLPPYSLLDKILEYYVEDQLGVNEIIAKGFDPETVKKVADLVDINEYKRRQAAPGVKITERAFGKDRRMPITNHYRAR